MISLAEIDAVYKHLMREGRMWQVLLCGNPLYARDQLNAPIIEVEDLPAVVRHNERRLEDGRLVVDTYVVNASDPVLAYATADFMAVDVLEGENLTVGRARMGDPGDEPAR